MHHEPARARTVRGDVDVMMLGVVDAHDHLFLTSAALPGLALDALDAAMSEAASFAAQGGGALVQWSPAGTGRRLSDLAAISSATGIHIIAATGRHRAEHYPPTAAIRTAGVDKLTAWFIGDITRLGCGLLKIGTGYWRLDDFEQCHLHAAAAAAMATGVPVAVHCERGTAAHEVLDLLMADGLPAERVLLGHLGRFPDRHAIAEVLARGAYASFDAPSSGHHSTDWATGDLLASLIKDGHGERLLLGADTTNKNAQPARGGAPGTSSFLTWCHHHLRPAVGEPALQQMLVANPARALALSTA